MVSTNTKINIIGGIFFFLLIVFLVPTTINDMGDTVDNEINYSHKGANIVLLYTLLFAIGILVVIWKMSKSQGLIPS